MFAKHCLGKSQSVWFRESCSNESDFRKNYQQETKKYEDTFTFPFSRICRQFEDMPLIWPSEHCEPQTGCSSITQIVLSIEEGERVVDDTFKGAHGQNTRLICVNKSTQVSRATKLRTLCWSWWDSREVVRSFNMRTFLPTNHSMSATD